MRILTIPRLSKRQNLLAARLISICQISTNRPPLSSEHGQTLPFTTSKHKSSHSLSFCTVDFDFWPLQPDHHISGAKFLPFIGQCPSALIGPARLHHLSQSYKYSFNHHVCLSICFMHNSINTPITYRMPVMFGLRETSICLHCGRFLHPE